MLLGQGTFGHVVRVPTVHGDRARKTMLPAKDTNETYVNQVYRQEMDGFLATRQWDKFVMVV